MKKKAPTNFHTVKEKTLALCKKNYVWIGFGILLLVNTFLQFYQLWERAHFGWDQVDVAWNAKKILVDSDYPIFGMIAKGNTGFHIGPAYYYLAAFFYKLTGLHPIASPLLAALSGVAGFCILFFVTRKIFSNNIALIAAAISTFSYYILQFDKIQWPVNFIAPVSLLVFYSLYKIATGSPKYFFLLATMLGISLHLHFTAIFYFILVILTLPFVPRNKNTFLYAICSLPLFLIWLIPFGIAIAQGSNIGGTTTGYLQTSFHGLHARRVLQLTRDAFIEFQGILFFPYFACISFFFLPLFVIVYLYKNVQRDRLILCYLTVLWFVLPWLAFSTYSGEISNYYFSMTRPISLMILAFLTWKTIIYRWYIGVIVVIFWIYYMLSNIQHYLRKPENEFDKKIMLAKERIKKGEPLELHLNAPEAYWQWYFQVYKKQ